ncbi:ABC transporter related protein [Pseudodesulfovibrio profundus]|uniref:ABC transporter related protein n=1 Tax=Pseudodesulfovibrio profundus TaxID=57320 RepID=A0A2C8F2V9_9BACT|nr:ABC transporter ATP-binding protein [Pseudodesulfovibrio profundus]MBC16530.1 ABC transporter ATP-binding protein [Desulfovibrio sp.]SOB57045.1 ABC transporter related protein [Pseudodesulfovibrio profundus]|tara:strand:- start:576 stop:1232 length:657 start_codon:yes stop_codon:yes gene_type:complete
MSSPIIKLDNVQQVFSNRTVLSIETLELGEGEIVGLAGPNGSGKSTLLKLLAFIDSPTSGVIEFCGIPTSNKPGAVHRQATLLVQEPYLLKRTVYANIAYGLRVRKKNDISTKVHNALVEVGLDPNSFSQRQWFELSGGEAQRVALAARLVLKPKVLLMDEPTASLDTKSAQLIRTAALNARDQYGTSLVIASHDLPWLGEVSDRTIHLEHGKIVEIT